MPGGWSGHEDCHEADMGKFQRNSPLCLKISCLVSQGGHTDTQVAGGVMNGIMRGIDALKATQRPSSDLHTLGFTRSITLSMLFGTRRHRNTETCFFFKNFFNVSYLYVLHHADRTLI